MTSHLYAQMIDKDSLRILYAQFDTIEKYQFIPTNALHDNYDLLIIGFEYDTIKVTNKKSIEISWPSLYIDGRYHLVITPKQIYLRSGHDNPNPNYLYWMTNINGNQFCLIKAYFNSQRIKQLENITIDNSYRQSFFFINFKKEKYLKNDWTNMRYDNFVKLVDLINKPLKSSNNNILIPNRVDFDKIKPLRLVFGLEELDSQIKMIKIK